MKLPLEFWPADVNLHAIGNSKKGRATLERVFVFPPDNNRDALRYELPSLYRTHEYTIRTFERTVKADGLEMGVSVVVVRRRT